MLRMVRQFGTYPLAKKLWLTGSGVALFIGTLAVANFFIGPDRAVTRAMLGHDFQVFYTAGTFVNTGRSGELYDLNKIKDFEAELGRRYKLDVGPGFGPIWNPPFFSWIFSPLARLPYPQALSVWFGVSLLSLGISLLILMHGLSLGLRRRWRMKLVDQGRSPAESVFLPVSRMIYPPCSPLPPVPPRAGWSLRAVLLPMLVLSSMPFVQALSHGQNTFLSLLLLTITVMFWRSERALLAGLLGGLLFYKPQLGMVVAVAMMLTQGRRAVLGLVITGTALLLVNVLTLPGTLAAFMVQMPKNLRFMQEQNAYFWERHVTFKGFWRLLIQGHEIGPTSWTVSILSLVCMTAVTAGLLYAVMEWRKERTPAQTDRLIAATVCSMPLLMPFYFDYDMLLMAIPATLLARGITMQGRDRKFWADRWVVRCWGMLFIATMVNAGTAKLTHVNLTVPALSAVAACMIARAIATRRRIQSTATTTKPLRAAA